MVAAARPYPGPNGASPSTQRTSIIAVTLSTTMLAPQAIAAPRMPIRGNSTRFSPTLTISAAPALMALHELFPPISRTTVILPVPRLTSMASESTASAAAPAV